MTENGNRAEWRKGAGLVTAVTVLMLLLLTTANGHGARLQVIAVEKDGTQGVLPEYRWVIEEDDTYRVVPGATDPATLAVRFHSSYMPVVAQGDNTVRLPDLDPAKRYFVSVLPKVPGTYSIGGAQLIGNGKVTVYVNALPLPTAQISVFVHEDISPISNTWDQGEKGLEGFRIVLEDGGGRYGMSAAMQMTDAYGNALGTVYVQTCDQNGQNQGTGGYGCLDQDGIPIIATDAGGNPIVEPLLTGPDGRLTIKNLAPGKYGIIVVPPNAVEDPPGSGNYVSSSWVQTSTIEGKKVIDAWVKANEPSFFAEFGPPGPHVSIGFVPAGPNSPYIDSTVLTGGATITGQVVNLHLSRPPNTAFYDGAPFPHTTPWVGLNQGAAGQGRGVYAARANDDGTFAIPNVPPGNYQLVIWDDNLDLIFSFLGVTVNGPVDVNLGTVPVFQWFTRLENWVFYDSNENGFRDAGETGIPGQAVNLRWRDGSMYQSAATDGMGFVPFDEVFPFFAWLVAEVDYARYKATGLTVTVDDGGSIPFADPWSWEGQLNPQVQGTPPDPASVVTTPTYRTEQGPVLTQGFMGFLGQTSVFEWGKVAYAPGENGGISGVVYYSVTRAEDDPEHGFAEPWEPGIPRVTVNLYAYDPAAPDRKGALLNTTVTDSWDDNPPADCQYGGNAGSTTDAPYVFRGVATDCYDGMRNWNQVRPGVFDGGYAFDSIIDPADGVTVVSPIPSGRYVVEVVVPTGYELVRSQDKNVDFGDEYIPSAQLLPPQCVGTPYTVPAELSLFPGVPAPLAGQQLNDCDRKLITLSEGSNAAADFYLFTQVPVAGHIRGFILDDTANEFDPNSPQFSEKYAPPWMPISIRDWTGRIVATTYSDEYGAYNVLVPSTYSANLPQPSGMSPNMLTACMNDPEADTVGGFHHRQYSTFCYTLQYMPGTTTYLDTPVVPIAAFAGSDQNPLDCEFPDGTPRIYSVTNGNNQGPYVPTLPDGAIVDTTLTITSMGTLNVPNPAYDGTGGVEPKVVARDYGFGDIPGSVMIGTTSLTNVSWSNGIITGTVPPGTETGQLVVTRGDNALSSRVGVTVQVGRRPGSRARTVYPGQSIQDAIDAAGANDLILVAPGFYDEMVIMWKPVQLQGWGEGSTVINAIKAPPEKLVAWRQHVEQLKNEYDLVQGQAAPVGGIVADALFSEEGAAVLVLAKEIGPNSFSALENQGARIDGFTLTGADTGGGVVVNGFADYLDISNNRIISNSGFYGGGIRVGHPLLSYTHRGRVFYSDADNDNVRIRFNHITQNGGLDGAGGGVSICTGSDNYEVSGNYICGNFTMGDGAGIGHLGRSDNGLIRDNTILFNENFNQMMTVNGGGISIAGKPPVGCPVDPVTGVPDPLCLVDPLRALTPGSGSVRIERNLIQGNSSGAGDGGGIRLNRISGLDVADKPAQPETWYTVEIRNNMIVNNVAALAGGGISIQDSLRTTIVHNTIANNDNTSTSGEAFTPGQPNQSNAQPGAGVISRAHGSALAGFLPPGEAAFSDPVLVDNIIWQNRKFYFLVDETDPNNIISGLCPDINNSAGLNCTGVMQLYDDLAVLPPGTGLLNPTDSLLTDTTGYENRNNISAPPQFVSGYVNGNRQSTVTNPEGTTALQPVVAFDEGGNFIRLRYGPLTPIRIDNGQPYGDYHLQATSPAVDTGLDIGVAEDYDRDPRPSGTGVDMGADEVQQITLGHWLPRGSLERRPSVVPLDKGRKKPVRDTSGNSRAALFTGDDWLTTVGQAVQRFFSRIWTAETPENSPASGDNVNRAGKQLRKAKSELLQAEKEKSRADTELNLIHTNPYSTTRELRLATNRVELAERDLKRAAQKVERAEKNLVRAERKRNSLQDER